MGETSPSATTRHRRSGGGGDGSPWHSDFFEERELIRCFGQQGSAAGAGPAKRGPRIKDFWPKVLGYAAGWLAEKGEAPERQRELEDLILERVGELGGEADRSTVRPYAREMLAGYRAQLDDE